MKEPNVARDFYSILSFWKLAMLPRNLLALERHAQNKSFPQVTPVMCSHLIRLIEHFTVFQK